jgi:hypothetical protein
MFCIVLREVSEEVMFTSLASILWAIIPLSFGVIFGASTYLLRFQIFRSRQEGTMPPS